MTRRIEVVTSILKLVEQIARHDEFARDASCYADLVRHTGDDDGATLLRTMAIARKAEVMRMRGLMTKLATALAGMPIETDQHAKNAPASHRRRWR